MKRRFRCRDCGRDGAFGSFKARRTFPVAGFFRRAMNLHGEGLCVNRPACFERTAQKTAARLIRRSQEKRRVAA
jgi:hypothetical protein